MKELIINTNGVSLFVHEYENKGDVVIFLHFSTGNLTTWNPMLPYFIDHYHIIIPDIRGHGKSEKPPTGYTIDNFADDILGMMDALNIDKAHFVGSSMGGEIAISLAARYPERVHSIVCEGISQNSFGPNGTYDIPIEDIPVKKEELRAIRAKRKDILFDSKEEFIENMKIAIQKDGICNQYKLDFIEYDIYKTNDGKYIRSFPKWAMDEYLECYWDTRFENYFEKIKCPVLFLPSEDESQSEIVMRFTEDIRNKLKFSKIVHIKGALHAMVSFDYPEEFSKEVLEFYQEIK